MDSLPSIKKFSWLRHDGLFFLNPQSIKHLKNLADRLQKDHSKPLNRIRALDIVSRSFGFESWKHLQSTFQYESTGILATCRLMSSLDEAIDCYTLRQLHGAVYRHLGCRPIGQIIQVVFDEGDFVGAWLDRFKTEREALNLFLTKGLIEDHQLTQWLTDNDPYFQEPGEAPKAFRFIYPTQLTHSEALDTIEKIMLDIDFVGFSNSCWPLYVWIDGALPTDTAPPDIDDGYDDCPTLTLPSEAHPGIYE